MDALKVIAVRHRSLTTNCVSGPQCNGLRVRGRCTCARPRGGGPFLLPQLSALSLPPLPHAVEAPRLPLVRPWAPQAYAMYGFYPPLNQIEISPMFRASDIISFCNRNGILVEAYAPFGDGDRSKIRCVPRNGEPAGSATFAFAGGARP